MIFINHVPGSVLSLLTVRNYAVSDAAELFVLLAGCSLSFAIGAPGSRLPIGQAVLRLLKRSFDIYRAQMLITLIALAILGAAATATGDTQYIGWHGAGLFFHDTPRALVGLVLLTYQIGYFNILTLYVAGLVLVAALVPIGYRSRLAMLGASFAIYAVTLATTARLPSWPGQGAWFFNPLAWQFLIVIGFVATDFARESAGFRAWLSRVQPIAVGLVALGAILTVYQIWPDPAAVPAPRMFFLFDKEFLSPARIISVLALAIAFRPAFQYLSRLAGGALSRYFCLIGRNSLAAFSASSVLAIAGQVARTVAGGSLAFDIAIATLGVCVMAGAAWASQSWSGPSREVRRTGDGPGTS